MFYLIKAGGFVMWFVLLFGFITLAAAIFFARRPEEGKLGFVRAMSTTTVFTVIGGISANIATTLHRVAYTDEIAKSSEMPLYVMAGLSESLSPAIVGFSILGIAWLITAVGIRRLAQS